MNNTPALQTFATLSGLLAVILTALVVSVAGALVPNYSHTTQFISELNATGTLWAQWTGWFGFIPVGLLTIGFLWRLKAELAPSKRVYFGLAFAALVGTDSLVTALAPCDMGCPVMGDISLSQKIHLFSGLFTALLMPIGIYMLIKPLKQAGFPAYVGPLSWLLIVVSVLSQVVLMAGLAAGYMGVVQRIAVGTYCLYLGVLSLATWQRLGRRSPDAVS